MILGIDPGFSGAFAWLNDSFGVDHLRVFDMPIKPGKTRGKDIDTEKLRQYLCDLIKVDLKHVVLEKVWAYPGQGASSGFKFGEAYGLVHGAIMMAFPDAQIHLIPAAVWKADMGLTKAPTETKAQAKDKSRHHAIEVFPDHTQYFKRKKDDGRAEASLLAFYGRRTILAQVT